MNDKQGAVLMAAVLFVLWLLFSPVKQDQVPMQPTDGLIEQVEVASDSLNNVDQDTAPIEQPEKKPEILIFVSKTCPPCEKWKRVEMQKFIDAGWSVGIVEVHRFSITPTFEITGSETVTHQGYLTFEQAKGKLK